MKLKYIVIIMLTALLGCPSAMKAQTEGITLGGSVMSESGEELIGVSIVVKNNPGQGTVTDMDGRFKMTNLKKGQVLVISYIGYLEQELNVTATNERLRIIMKEDVNMMDEVVVVGRGTQRKISVTGAVTNVEVASLQVPASSVSNMLGGRVPGIIAVTRSGEPGNDFSEFWIRGISTFGAGASALVLIDGVEGNLNDLNPADIESFSILKDASATAVYGMKGANGVVLVTTKRGVAGKLTINYKTNISLSHSARTPDYVNAHQYANLANEARVVRGQRPFYTDAELRLFETGLDSDLYPNIDWLDVTQNDHVWNQEHHISAAGGGTNARYYLSLGVQSKNALFKQDKNVNKYDTNINYNQYNFRANVDIDMTRSTNLTLGLETVIVNQNSPGFGQNSDDMWKSIARMTPVIAPLMYSDGSLPAFGANNNEITPYVLLNHTGYRKHYRNTNKINLLLKQDLSMLTKGLSMSLLFNLNSNSVLDSQRTKIPALYYANGRKRDGSLNLKQTVDPRDPSYFRDPFVERTYYYEGRVNYENIFAEQHRVTGLFNVNLSDYTTSKHYTDLTAIPKRYIAFSSRLTYSYKDTYNIEGNLGYTGSEAFENGKKFGWFPAISLAWVPTQYEWVKNNIPVLDFLKFRASYGMVGNDKLTWDDSVRFPYLTIMEGGGGSYWTPGENSIIETQVGSNNLRWEKSTKTNFGIDAKFFKQRFDLTVDFFKDVRSGIYQQRADIPDEMGLVSMPWANVGKMKSWGIDGHISYTQPFNKDTYLMVRANYTKSNSKVLQFEEPVKLYPYQTAVGYRTWVQRGFISEGLFKDQADIDNSPRQTLGGTIMPGDIKYKDVNADGVINWDDQVPLKYSGDPGINYGFAAEFNWKNWNINVFFEGAANVTYFYGQGDGGYGYYPFKGRESGNVLEIVADQKNRWTPASYSGNPATENPNARFPRLSYGDHPNNYVNSTHWMVSGSYLRLKNVQISYRWEKPFMQRIGLQNATFSLIGDNLHVWDKVGIWDPAQTKDSGMKYPIQRIYTLQVQLKF